MLLASLKNMIYSLLDNICNSIPIFIHRYTSSLLTYLVEIFAEAFLYLLIDLQPWQHCCLSPWLNYIIDDKPIILALVFLFHSFDLSFFRQGSSFDGKHWFPSRPCRYVYKILYKIISVHQSYSSDNFIILPHS